VGDRPEGSRRWGYVAVGCLFGVGSPPDVDRSPRAGAEAKVPGAVGSASGWLVYDRNSNHFSDGEGVPDTKIVLVDESTSRVVARTVTDARGHFVFSDVPAYRYEFRVVGPWQLASDEYRYFQVFGGDTTPDRHTVFVIPGPEQQIQTPSRRMSQNRRVVCSGRMASSPPRRS
jgi:hypothetical protein